MKLKLDLSREYGIVLEGGGARGSYQVGAWKALREAGIKIRGIAGASVGALNGALMCMDDLEQAEAIWENIRYSQVMDVDDERMNELMQNGLKAAGIQELLAEGKKLCRDRGLDVTPLRKLIGEAVDEEKIRTSKRELYVSTISLSDRKPLVVDIRQVPEGEIGDMLLASAYFPVFKLEKLGGKLYTDGGGANNVPVDVLAERGYRDILVIRIYGLGHDTEKYYSVPEGTRVYHIAPRQNLGGILEFDPKKARRNMALGYLDAKRLLYGLSGKRYYLDAPGTEAYYFDKMISEIHFFAALLKAEKRLAQALGEEETEEEEGKTEPIELEEIPEQFGYRFLTEKLFPELAVQCRLREDWNYKDLYLAVLEELAGTLRISRFQVYTVEELLLKIHQKARSLDSGQEI